MSLYLEQIRQLVSLQSVDDAILTIDNELKQAPREVEELTERFAGAEAHRNRILEKVNHLKEQEKRVNAELEEDGARIRKSKNKLMQVANAREYQAMAREMDGIEKINRTREEERTALLEEMKNQESALADATSAWSAVKAELEVKQANLEDRLGEARRRKLEMEKVRASTAAEVPRPVLDRYEFIRRRLSHPVIVSVTAGVCAGCRIAIPPQTFIELQGGHKILNCPNCQRLIYWSEHFRAPQEATETEGEACSSSED